MLYEFDQLVMPDINCQNFFGTIFNQHLSKASGGRSSI